MKVKSKKKKNGKIKLTLNDIDENERGMLFGIFSINATSMLGFIKANGGFGDEHPPLNASEFNDLAWDMLEGLKRA
jgi:hypothetical protein